MEKSKKLEFDYQLSSYLAFRHAQDFKKSAELLDDNRITKPVMVNIAFSCELYMKALLMWTNKTQDVIDKHKLDELFYQLSHSWREKIKKSLDVQNWECFWKDSADAFCAWRYYYEKDNVMFGHVGILFAFAEILDKICEETISLKEVMSECVRK